MPKKVRFGVTSTKFRKALKRRQQSSNRLAADKTWLAICSFTNADTSRLGNRRCDVCKELPAVYQNANTKVFICSKSGQCTLKRSSSAHARPSKVAPVYTPAMRLEKRRQLAGTSLHQVHLHDEPFFVRGYEDKSITLFQMLFTDTELSILEFKADLFTTDSNKLLYKDMWKSPTVCMGSDRAHDLDHWLRCRSNYSVTLIQRLFNFFQVSPSQMTKLRIGKPPFEIAFETKSLRRELRHESSLNSAISKAVGACSENPNLHYFFLNWTETSVTLLYVNQDNKLQVLGSSIIFLPGIVPVDAKWDLKRRQNLHRRAHQEISRKGYGLASTSAEKLQATLTNCLLNDASRPFYKAKDVRSHFVITLQS